MKTIGVIGAYGLIGVAICSVLENDPTVKLFKIKFDGLHDLPYNLDCIVDCVGYGQPQKFTIDKIGTIDINTRFITELFRHLKLEGKFLFVSTSEVYSGAESPHKETDIGTTNPQHPRACYIEGKRCGEAICMAYKEQGYDIKIARLALAYGPGTKKGDTRVLNQLIEQALTTGEIRLLDDGSAFRTYCYVKDAAEMMLDILFKGTDVVYNVGGFSDITIRDLADTIALMTRATVIPGRRSLDGAPSNVKLDMTKTVTEFPRSFTSMYDGLTKTIEYQKELYA